MGDFLVVAAETRGGAVHERSEGLASLAAGDGFVVSRLNPHAWLAVRGPCPPACMEVGPWSLIGDVFDRRRPILPVVHEDDPLAYERRLMTRVWGRYVGLHFGTGDRIAALMRDPSGAMECVAWTGEGLTVVCSSVQDWLIRSLKPAWTLDINRVASSLRDPIPSTGRLFLDGPTALEPGTVQPFPLDREAQTIWRPSDIARASLDGTLSPELAAESLRDAVDEAVAGLAGLPGPLAAEVSGGLDSAIVASSLRHGVQPVRLWLNAYGASPESDERNYVAALARKLHFEATMVPHAAAPLTEAALAELSPDFRPGLNALDRAHDLDWAERLTGAGALAVLTGKGGDSVLLNRATADVFVDQWLQHPWRTLRSADVHELAAGNELSIWTLVRRARAHRRCGTARPRRDHPLTPPLSSAASIHPWTEDWDDFGPAKAMHIASLADNVARHGPSTLTRVVDVRNPLCAQPVLEACLSLPASTLTIGGRDRGLARRAFADRLPSEIIDRRSKGDMTRIYGRMILDSLPVLRPWLIEGRLAALGVIDRAAAERELTREALVWRGRYSTIIVAAAFESWVRAWEDRLSPAR